MFNRKRPKRVSTVLEVKADLEAGRPVEEIDPEAVSSLIEAVLAITREGATKAQEKLDRASKELEGLRLPAPGPTERIG